MLERHTAEEVSELAPGDELSRRVTEVVAEAEEVDVRQRRVLLCVAHDRHLVRAHLNGPLGEPQQVERRKDRDQRERRGDVGPLRAPEPATRHEQVR